MGETDIATLKRRMAAVLETDRICVELLEIEPPPIKEHATGGAIDQLIEGFDMLDGLGKVIQKQLSRL